LLVGSAAFFATTFFRSAIDFGIGHNLVDLNNGLFYRRHMYTLAVAIPGLIGDILTICFPVGFIWYALRVRVRT
jgi:hypothetical protein